MRNLTTKKKTPADRGRKALSVPLEPADFAMIAQYQAAVEARELVAPKEGPAARALIRAGLRALGYTVPVGGLLAGKAAGS